VPLFDVRFYMAFFHYTTDVFLVKTFLNKEVMRHFRICDASPRNRIILVGKRYETALRSVMDLHVLRS